MADPTGSRPGPDGNLWFTEGQSSSTNIGRVNPTSGAITLYPEELPIYRPWMITTGPDGNLWFTEVERNPRLASRLLIHRNSW